MKSVFTAWRFEPRHRFGVLIVAALALVAGAVPAQAHEEGPFGQWLVLEGNTGSASDPGHGYVLIPHHPALNPTSGITIEMWVKLQTPFTGNSCRSLFGKDYTQAYWIGVCGSTLRAYLRGSGSSRDAGEIPDNQWVHIAVTSDGVTQRHYINGVEVGTFPAGGAPTTSPDEVRIGSDVSWPYSPEGAIDEVRLWSIALTASQIQDRMHEAISSPRTGLVAVWSLDGNALDAVGPFDGTLEGNTAFETIPAPPAGPWLSSSSLPGFRFKVRISPPGQTPFLGTQVADCVPETVCVAGALPTRTEVFLRVIGPRPNGFFWAQVIKFTVSGVEVWVEQTSTGEINYYQLEQLPADSEVLPGLVDKEAFRP